MMIHVRPPVVNSEVVQFPNIAGQLGRVGKCLFAHYTKLPSPLRFDFGETWQCFPLSQIIPIIFKIFGSSVRQSLLGLQVRQEVGPRQGRPPTSHHVCPRGEGYGGGSGWATVNRWITITTLAGLTMVKATFGVPADYQRPKQYIYNPF